MRNYLLLIFLLVAFTHSAISQTLKKYPISKSGCSAYFYCDPGKFELTESPDSSKVYTGECTAANVIYDIICVKLSEPMKDLNDAEDVLLQYLDYLKSQFKITSSGGYGKGHKLKGYEKARGVIDYWSDDDKNHIKIKGWTNGQYIAVLMAISEKELNETKVNLFLDGIVFPPAKP